MVLLRPGYVAHYSKVNVQLWAALEIYNPESVTGTGKGGFLDLNTGDIRVAGVGGIGTNFNVDNNYKNFAPRLGIAYQIAPKTVVRLGYWA
jgi:hypothetical protein